MRGNKCGHIDCLCNQKCPECENGKMKCLDWGIISAKYKCNKCGFEYSSWENIQNPDYFPFKIPFSLSKETMWHE